VEDFAEQMRPESLLSSAVSKNEDQVALRRETSGPFVFERVLVVVGPLRERDVGTCWIAVTKPHDVRRQHQDQVTCAPRAVTIGAALESR
jgi:hypothetical protein